MAFFNMTMKPLSRWLITGIACVLVFAALAAFKFFQIQAAIAYGQSFPEPSESVEGYTTELATFDSTVNAIGHVVAPQAMVLRNEVEGLISEINFASGDQVKKGEVLVQLDISEESARLKAAIARVELTKLALQRAERLIRQKGVSEETVDQARANYAIAQADVQALEAAIAKKTLQAPFDAVAGLHQWEVGEFLQSNTDIVTLLGINDFSWVDFNLPWGKANLKVGDTVMLELPGETVPQEARIIARNPIVSASSRNLTYRARVDAALVVPPNTVVRVIVPIGSSEQIKVPRTAVLVDSMGDHVYVLEPNTKTDAKGYRAKRRQITIAYKDEDVVGVVDGLQEGELIAARGAFKLLPNMLTYVRERVTESATDAVTVE